MIEALSSFCSIKSLHLFVLSVGIAFFMQFPVSAQSDVEEKVERYLYTCYDSGKAGLKENERVLGILEQRLNDFIFAMDKPTAARMKAGEKEFNEFLSRADKVKEVKMMQQMVEDSKRSHRIFLANLLERGIQSVEEAEECRKLIVFKMMELDLLRMKQEKLVALLKDENSRGKFIHAVLNAGNFGEQVDLRNLMVAVDKGITEFDM